MALRLFILLVVAAICGSVQAATVSEGTILAQAESKREQAKKQKAVGDRYLKAGKHKAALKAYKQAGEMDASWYEPHEATGNMLFSSKKYLKAVEAFKKAIAIEPRYSTGYYNIAFAYRKSKKYDKAAEYYEMYIKRKASDPDAYYGLAATYEAMGKIKQAIKNYELYAQKETRPSERQYIVKAKNKAEKLRQSLGIAVAPKKEKPTPSATASRPTATGSDSKPATTATVTRPATRPDPEKTKPASTTAVKETAPSATTTRDPGVSKPTNKITALLAKGDKAMQQKSYTSAMKAYFDAVKLDSKNVEALYRLGLVYQATGNVKAAKMKWRTALSIDPRHLKTKEALQAAEGSPKPKTSVAVKSGQRPSVAPTKTTTAATSKTSSPTAKTASTGNQRVKKLMAEGDAHFRKKSFSRAIAKYTHATQLAPSDEEALFKLGMAYAMGGNYKIAIFKWKKVLKLNPNNESAKRNIERAKAKVSGGSAPKKAAAKPEPKPAPKKVVKTQPPKKAVVTPPSKGASFEALMAWARQMKKKGDAKGVLKAVDKALNKKDDAQAFLLRGEALVILKRYSEAKRAFSKAMVQNPNLAAPFYGLGETSRLSGDKDRARYYFKMYVRSKAKDVSPAKIKKAELYLKK
jgi:tetratricopeptide (TPR) repeat protein